MATPWHFDPDRVAYYERAGWEAYYARRWGRVFWLMLQLNRVEFKMSWLLAARAALDVARASVAFAPLDNALPAARAHLTHYFDKVRRSAGVQAAASGLAERELDYWIVHRQLALERQQAPDHTGDIEPMIVALAHLHAALFNASPAAMRPSAEWRALAAQMVDRITGGYSHDVAGDWQQIEQHLQRAYRAVLAAQTQG